MDPTPDDTKSALADVAAPPHSQPPPPEGVPEAVVEDRGRTTADTGLKPTDESVKSKTSAKIPHQRQSPDSKLSSAAHARSASKLLAPLTHPNGVSIFPSLSTNQQNHLSEEAFQQAQGNILADTDGGGPSLGSDTESDRGYESDDLGSDSLSLSSSIRDYLYENGRRYHRFREGLYSFPNDESEQEREDMKHAMMVMLCGQNLLFAPIGSHPQQILDIGTGTGIWAIEVGDLYPSAEVLGIDLSPIQPEWTPPNVRFMVDDAESSWLYPRNHFDYIHTRHTVMAIRDWSKLLRRAIEHLKPGGWMEMQEVHHFPLSATEGGVIPADNPIVMFWKYIREGLLALNVAFDSTADGRMSAMLTDAGFENVTERVLHIPIGAWPRNRVLKTVGIYWRTILIDGLQAIALGPLTRGLGWSSEEVEVFLVKVRAAYFDASLLLYMRLHIVFGQRL